MERLFEVCEVVEVEGVVIPLERNVRDGHIDAFVVVPALSSIVTKDKELNRMNDQTIRDIDA